MSFDKRWKIAAAAARRAMSEKPAEMPFGFATRVVAHWQAEPPAWSTALWQTLAVRVLGAMLLVLALLTALEFSDRDRDTWRPEIGDTVAEHFWML